MIRLNQADKKFIEMLIQHCFNNRVLESFLMSQKEIYRAERLAKAGLIEKGKFDGVGNSNVYYPKD